MINDVSAKEHADVLSVKEHRLIELYKIKINLKKSTNYDWGKGTPEWKLQQVNEIIYG